MEWAGAPCALGLVIGCEPLDLLFQGGDSLQEPLHVLLCPQLSLPLGLLHLALIPALQLSRHRLEETLSHLANGKNVGVSIICFLHNNRYKEGATF